MTTEDGTPRSLRLPLVGASFSTAIVRFFRKYVDFGGRASRSEYWWVVLALTLASFAVQIAADVADGPTPRGSESTIDFALPFVPGIGVPAVGLDSPWGVVASLLALAVLLPSLSLSWRRLHDTDRSGWWYLIVLIPVVGWIAMLIFMLQAPRPEGARFDRRSDERPIAPR
ncbi:hypothetical protein GCM10009846_13690 [Agrococcus versicolor]|uniref:DUF805 domain-containing protein n=1 Tax=Agrococcus versicolor TaxID=501482 RepID=A0ABP5MEY5_9MICO